MIRIIGVCVFTFTIAAATSSSAGGYLVVSLVDAEDPYHEAAAALALLRGGDIVRGSAESIEDIQAVLAARQPEYVAIVLRPQQLDINLVRKFLVLASKLDDDPFVDVSYGFITGATAEVAVRLARAGCAAEEQRRPPSLGMILPCSSVVQQSCIRSSRYPLLHGSFPQKTLLQAIDQRRLPRRFPDLEAMNRLLSDLDDSPIVVLVGHGTPTGVSGSLRSHQLAQRSFRGSVVMNVACSTGVTEKYFHEDQRRGRYVEAEIPGSHSFCLRMLETDVAGYVAYACSRPAGPAMHRDVATLVSEGISVGELRRRDANLVVLAHLDHGLDGLVERELFDGKPLPEDRHVSQYKLELATGGVLFGDPAYQPFSALPGEHPLAVTLVNTQLQIDATVRVDGRHLFWHCGDGLAMTPKHEDWASSIRTIVPLGSREFKRLDVESLMIGDVPLEHRITTAIESHAGARLLHVKVAFNPYDENRRPRGANLVCRFRVTAPVKDDATQDHAGSVLPDVEGGG